MTKIATVFLLALLVTASGALACGDSIYDIQTNPSMHPVGSLGVPCDVVVTATRYNGFFCQQATDPAINPSGEYSGIWVYTSSDLGYVPGDTLAVCGVVTEYYGLTELDVPAAGLYGYVLQTGSGAPMAPYYVAAAQLLADGEPWESVQVTVVDGMMVMAGFSLGFGEWYATAFDGSLLRLDDYWYDFASVLEGQCYNSATGIYTFGYGNFKLEPSINGIDVANCTVEVESASLGAIKAMYR